MLKFFSVIIWNFQSICVLDCKMAKTVIVAIHMESMAGLMTQIAMKDVQETCLNSVEAMIEIPSTQRFWQTLFDF